MSALDETIEEARALLAAGNETKALQLLHAAADATHDPELLAEIHELAAMGHASSRGFHKIEWHRLMFESEPTAPTAA